jgi:hypothetical protein
MSPNPPDNRIGRIASDMTARAVALRLFAASVPASIPVAAGRAMCAMLTQPPTVRVRPWC